jgi:hypothetical protein
MQCVFLSGIHVDFLTDVTPEYIVPANQLLWKCY